jgi:homoserine O-succinyltransferase
LLPAAGLDALIIAGAPPRAGDLRAEPYWDGLTRLIDWADGGVLSTYFSCPAAHAAVLHRDGIARRKLTRKLSGVFAVQPVSDAALLAGIPATAQVPHSRRDDVPEETLTARDYRILSRLADGGVDLFMRRGRSLQVFAQGHPEYDAGTLGREYLRDLERHLQDKAERPAVPEGYFDRVTENRLAELDARGADDLAAYNAVVMGAVPLGSWRGYTVRLFANWLAGIAAEKIRRSANRTLATPSRKRA